MSTEVQQIDCTIEEYHARDEYSHSQGVLLPDDPVTFCRRHVTKVAPFKPNASMKLGTEVHRILLDGTEVLEIPDEVLSNGAKRGTPWKEFKAEHSDKVPVKSDDPILHMVASVRAEPYALKLLTARGYTEQTLIYRDKVTGLPLRARPDRIVIFPEGIVIPELKTGVDPLPGERHFMTAVATLNYHRQAAWYWDAVERWQGEGSVEAFVWIAVRNKEPYECVVHVAPRRAIELGRRENRAGLNDLKRRLDAQEWNLPTHGQLVEDEDLPEWRYRKEIAA